MNIFPEILRLCQSGNTFAIATIVSAEGSTPRKQGAKLLVRPDGSTLDTLGGGCVEAEVWQEAMQAMRRGSSTVLEFRLDDDLAAESGLVCGGTVEILIDAVTGGDNLTPIIQKIIDSRSGGKKVTLTTVLRTADSSIPTGAKIMIEEGGHILLSVPGLSSLDGLSREIASCLPSTGEPQLLSIGGTQLFAEVFQPLETVLIIGAGHISKALHSLAKLLGFRVVVVDDREDFANCQRFTEADEVIAAPIVETIQKFPISNNTLVIIVTRGHKLDYEVLREVVDSPAAYVGMIGSRRKVALFYRQLLAEGSSLEKLRRIHAPIGLNLGAVTPEEIALSIMAEVVMEKLGGDGRSLTYSPDILAEERK